MLKYAGIALMALQLAQTTQGPYRALTWLDIHKRVARFDADPAKVDVCEADSETEGRIVYETHAFSDGRRDSLLMRFPTVKPNRSLSGIAAYDLGSKGAFEIVFYSDGAIRYPVFEAKTARENMEKHPNDKEWMATEQEVAGVSAKLNELKELVLKDCRISQ